MAKSRKRDSLNREVLTLIVTVFIVGIGIGFLFGIRAVEKTHKAKSVVIPKAEMPAKERPAMRQPLGERKFQPISQKPKIAIVIDDVGYDNHLGDLLWSFPHAVTLAIIPELKFSEFFAKEGKKHGFEIILHQPMEPIRKLAAEDPTMIKTGMNDKTVSKILDKNLKTVKTAVGINNHMGSLATQDRLVMRTVLKELKKKNMFFLDSLTTSQSVGREEAQNIGLPYLSRDVFLDNELEADYIHAQMEQLVHIARSTGSAIGIGHYKYNTLSVLKEELERLKDQGFEVVMLRDLLPTR